VHIIEIEQVTRGWLLTLKSEKM